MAPPVSVTRTAPPPAAPATDGVSDPSQVTSRTFRNYSYKQIFLRVDLLWPTAPPFSVGLM